MARAAFIGHYFHKKTRSSVFFSELINEQFEEVEQFFFDPDNCGGFEFGRLLAKPFDAYFFWQSEQIAALLLGALPGVKYIIPMFDGAVMQHPTYWRAFSGSIFIAFSAQLQTILQRAQCDTVHVQYFPPPHLRTWKVDDSPSAYFWERRPNSSYDASHVLAACEKLGVRKLTIHLAADYASNPDQRQAYLKTISQKYPDISVSYSQWYEDSAAAKRESARHAVYFSPREAEGIGMSFLEAMANGQVVVSPDQATMSEYIVSGYNGLLLSQAYTIMQSDPLSSSDLVKMSNNALDSVKLGYNRWKTDEDRLRTILARGKLSYDTDGGASFLRQLRISAGKRAQG